MDQMDKSGLVLYSLGIVVVTKLPGTDDIYVTPIEHLNIQDNKLIKDNKQTFKNNLPDKTGKVEASEVKSTNTLKAKWIPFGHSNRTSAPDVVANETVILFKYADVDEYFWTTIFREKNIRRLENVLYSYSNLATGLKEFDMKSSYWVNVNTKAKVVQLHTSDNDGEHCTYDVIIETKKGVLTVIDGKKNYIEMKSVSDDLNIEFNRDINDHAKRDVNTKADCDITESAGRNITEIALQDIIKKAATNITMTAGAVVDVTAGVQVICKAPVIILRAPNIILDGDVIITGTLTVGKITTTNGLVSTTLETSGHNTLGGDTFINGNKIS
jgi:phage baseplate assembly protein gpV